MASHELLACTYPPPSGNKGVPGCIVPIYHGYPFGLSYFIRTALVLLTSPCICHIISSARVASLGARVLCKERIFFAKSEQRASLPLLSRIYAIVITLAVAFASVAADPTHPGSFYSRRYAYDDSYVVNPSGSPFCQC
jgi:hypothetical protein